MLKVYICEDIKVQREKIAKVVENVILMEDLDMEIGAVTDNPMEILEHVKNSEHVGIYFLDIDLNASLNGLGLAKELRKYDPRGFIVFVTTHSEMSYMTFIYKLEAMDFILKDNENEIQKRVYQCILKANQRFSSQNNNLQANFTLKTNGKMITVDYDEILFFETSANIHKVILHAKNRVVEFNGKMKEVEEQLDERFYRCHRSFIVNRDNIKEVDMLERVIYMINGESCLVSSRMMKGLK